jgi:riboflavin kinase
MQTTDNPFDLIVSGRVRTGVGNFGYWIGKLADYYHAKTGMQLYPGTLNVELDDPYALPSNVTRLEASEYGGSVSVNIVPCTINGRRAFVLRTDSNEAGEGRHATTIVEVASDVRLRDEFNLRDGDVVELRLPREQK